MITHRKQLIDEIKNNFRLALHGIHGISHWSRVKNNGFIVAEHTGANLAVVELFAYFHDSCRVDDNYDPDHGRRAVEFAATLRGVYFQLDDDEFELLSYACAHHTAGHDIDDVTISTCWDADRLDLGRIGIRPDPDRLCTQYAKRVDVIQMAWDRSIKLKRMSSTSFAKSN